MEGILFPILSAVLLCALVFMWWRNSQQSTQTKLLEQAQAAQDAQVTQLREQVHELQRVTDLAQSQEQLAKYATQAAQEQSSKLEAQVQKLEMQLTQLQQTNQELQTYKETAQLEFQKQEHKLSNQVEILEADKSRLAAQVEQLNEAKNQELTKLRNEHEEQINSLKNNAQEAENRAQKNFDELFNNFKNSTVQQQQETKTTYEKQLADLKNELNKKKEENAQEQTVLKTEYESRIRKLTDDYEARLKAIQDQAHEMREKQALADKESFNAALKAAADNFEEQKAQIKANYEEHFASLKQKQEETKIAYEKQIDNLQQLQKQELQRMHEQHAQEFQQFKENFEKRNLELSNHQSSTFVEKTTQQLELITNPLKVQLADVSQRLEGLVSQSKDAGISMRTNVDQLGRYVVTIAEQSNDLVNALRKNNKKALGNWGEMQLEILLEECGFVKNKTFFTQQRTNEFHHKTQIPDFVLRLPENRHIIIDVKTTLDSYVEVTAAKTQEEERIAAQKLITNVNNHVKNLQEKKYTENSKLPACDFVLMYIPIENVLNIITEYAPELFNTALTRKIIIVTNTTIVPILTIIANQWKNYELQKNVQEVIKIANSFYSTLAPLSEKMIKLGQDFSKGYSGVVKDLTRTQGVLNRLKKYNDQAEKAIKSLDDAHTSIDIVDEQTTKLQATVKTHLKDVNLNVIPQNVEAEAEVDLEEIAAIKLANSFFYIDVDADSSLSEQSETTSECVATSTSAQEAQDSTLHNLSLSFAPSVLQESSLSNSLEATSSQTYALAQQATDEIGVVDSDWNEDSEAEVNQVVVNPQDEHEDDISLAELEQLHNVVAQTTEFDPEAKTECDMFVDDMSEQVTDWLSGNYFYYEARAETIKNRAKVEQQIKSLYHKLLRELNTPYRDETTQEFVTFAQVFYEYQAQGADEFKLESFAGWHPYDVLNLVLGVNNSKFQAFLHNIQLGEQILTHGYPKLRKLQDKFYQLQDPQYIMKDHSLTHELFAGYDEIFKELED